MKKKVFKIEGTEKNHETVKKLLLRKGVIFSEMYYNDQTEDLEGVPDEEIYKKAKELVLKAGKCSTAILQSRLHVGYSRAARIIDMLEEERLIGPPDGSRSRKVLKYETK